LTGLSGIYVPLITPFYKNQLDRSSLTALIHALANQVQGFVPCLSSGEGQLLNDDQWEQVVETTRRSTDKPVLAGVKRDRLADSIQLVQRAEALGCDGVVMPVLSNDGDEVVAYFRQVAEATTLPIVLYNTETTAVSRISVIRQLEAIANVIGIKDSSMNEAFFKMLCGLRQGGDLSLSILQGMEHQLQTPPGCDGYLVSLANVEPALCQRMYQTPSDGLNEEILELFWRYNLGGDWLISLKSILFCRGLIRSAEQVSLAIKPGLAPQPLGQLV
jgi:4-hydroxy-tetrahydrodipicolinate synthase